MLEQLIQPRMALSGVRSSCDSVARNWSFISLASSASARRANSASLRRVTAIEIPSSGPPGRPRTRRGPCSHPSHRAVGADDPILDVVRLPPSTAQRMEAITRSRSAHE